MPLIAADNRCFLREWARCDTSFRMVFHGVLPVTISDLTRQAAETLGTVVVLVRGKH